MDPLARLVSHEQTEKDVMSNEHMSFDDIDATHVSRSMPKCELAGSYMVARSKETSPPSARDSSRVGSVRMAAAEAQKDST